MSDSIILPSSESIEAVIFERQRLEKEKNPDIQLVDKVVLKNGPQAFKTASHWIFVNRHTGEINHHQLRLETFRRSKAGWIRDLEHSLTLEDKDEKEVTRLLTFLNVVLDNGFSNTSGTYLTIPVDKFDENITINSSTFQELLNLSQRVDADTLTTIVEKLSDADHIVNISDGTLNRFFELSEKSGINILSRLVDWLMKSRQIEQVVDKLETLNAEDLQKLNTAIGLGTLKNLLDIWKTNKNTDNENFWQQVLAQNSFVFAQVFAFPVVIIKERAYVGGKGISNTGGNIVDFLCKNDLTMNTALIEIKTPKTKILSTQYRGDIYNISNELSGSVIQIANYKNILTKSYYTLVDQSEDRFEVFDPRCVIILGTIGEEIKERKQQKSFELFRMALKDIQVITYDELFGKIEILINILEGENIV